MVNTRIRLIILFAAKDGEALYSQQKQDRELTVAQNMNSLLPNSDLHGRNQGKPVDHSVQFSSVAQSSLTLCDPMNHSTPGLPVHHQLLEFTQKDYTVEVRNRFKGLDLIDRVPDELWMEVCDIVQETGIKTSPKKKKCKKAKWLSEEALRIDTTRDYHTK